MYKTNLDFIKCFRNKMSQGINECRCKTRKCHIEYTSDMAGKSKMKANIDKVNEYINSFTVRVISDTIFGYTFKEIIWYPCRGEYYLRNKNKDVVFKDNDLNKVVEKYNML